jgi:hypothetical protein
MKRLSASRLSLHLTALVSACLLVFAISGIFVSAQQCNVCPPQTPSQYGTPEANAWRQNSTVTVNINPYWPEAQRDCVRTAFNNWANAGNSGVTFNFTYNSTPSANSNTIQVNWQTPSADPVTGYQPRGETFNFPRADNSSLSRSVINIDPRVNNCTALIDVMSHEIGHTFGLGDCPECCPGTTVMDGPYSAYPDYFNEETNARTTGPGSCDVATVNVNGNYDPNSVNPVLPSGGGGISEGGGGGGYYYPCTPYYWVEYWSWDGGETWEMVDMWYAGCW